MSSIPQSQSEVERPQFSVCLFFPDGTHHYVRRFVSAQEAADSARYHCNSVGARTGILTRLIITDGEDAIAFEWKFGEGVVFPSEAA